MNRRPQRWPGPLPAALLFASFVAPLWAQNLGHRLGGDVYKPENTLHAYRQALEKLQDDPDFHYVELDIQETKDAAIVVFHDTGSIKRIVPQTPANLAVLAAPLKEKPFAEICIRDLTGAQVRKLVLDHDARIPTLEEVLRASVEWKLRKPMLIEVKSLHTDGCREALLALVSGYRNSVRVDFMAFPDKFRDSFPDPLRWKVELRRAGFKVYTPLVPKTDEFDQVRDAPPERMKTHFRTVLPARDVVIDAEASRVHRIDIDLPKVAGTREGLRIGIHHGHDDSGDGALAFRIMDEQGQTRISGSARSKGWQWFEVPLDGLSRVTLVVEDLDTQFTGKNPGNSGAVSAALAFTLD